MAGRYGEVIRRLRKARGWTNQAQLAEAAGVDKETIVRAENSGNVAIGTLQLIAAALDVNVTAFFCSRVEMSDEDALAWSRLTEEQRRFLRKTIAKFLHEPGPGGE